ncbi:hypothetical protein [Endozoicomonas sp. SCSIO W0465]|uniref:hypothetical protein n=1 Tax=Endozoicomonas sp. SCSIO W0465 TaxID=2918516 RepID=UPI002076184F|nr:hypothetical protein [Endozoicomonas sp. SCSIO W0465]USE36993.1 hypothetical protein MJO57_01780 [Endozoicomonas sp. SCSIO W0465]
MSSNTAFRWWIRMRPRSGSGRRDVLSVLDFEGGVLAEGWSDANGSEIVTLGGPYGVSPYEGEYGLELDNGAGGTPDALYYTVATVRGSVIK